MDDGTAVYAGYLPAAHSGSLAPLQSGTSALPQFEFVPMTAVDVPVVDIETQTDVEGFTAEVTPGLTYTSPGHASVRRDDSDSDTDLYRLYEVPGAPHAGSVPGCGSGSTFPVHLFVRAAAERLFEWAEEDAPAPGASRIELATQGVVSVAATDGHGNALAGVRSPFLDVPLLRYEAHSSPGAFCALAGRETALDAEVLAEEYTSADDYVARFTEGLDDTIAAGFLRQEDREEIIDLMEAKADALLS